MTEPPPQGTPATATPGEDRVRAEGSPAVPPPTRRGPPRPPPRTPRTQRAVQRAAPEAVAPESAMLDSPSPEPGEAACPVPISELTASADAAPSTPLELRMEDATVIGAVPAELLALSQRELEEEATSHYVVPLGLFQGARRPEGDRATTEQAPATRPAGGALLQATSADSAPPSLQMPIDVAEPASHSLRMPIDFAEPVSRLSRGAGSPAAPVRPSLGGWQARDPRVRVRVSAFALCLLLLAVLIYLMV